MNARLAYDNARLLLCVNDADLTEEEIKAGIRGLDYLLDKAEELEHRLKEA